jgi:hypothetical protein
MLGIFESSTQQAAIASHDDKAGDLRGVVAARMRIPGTNINHPITSMT